MQSGNATQWEHWPGLCEALRSIITITSVLWRRQADTKVSVSKGIARLQDYQRSPTPKPRFNMARECQLFLWKARDLPFTNLLMVSFCLHTHVCTLKLCPLFLKSNTHSFLYSSQTDAHIQMNSPVSCIKHMKGCLESLTVRKTQIKPTKYHFITSSPAIRKMTDSSKCWKGRRETIILQERKIVQTLS